MTRLTIILLALMLPVLMHGTPVHAQTKSAAKPPIEVTAEKTLEWNRTAKTYTARGKAVATQGTTELHADTLVAHYAEGGSTNLTRIDTHGNVLMISDDARLTGQRGFYNITKGMAELTGNNLKLVTPTDTVTARDKMTYDTNRREMQAHGKARAVRENETIESDLLIARFVTDPATGNDKLDEMEAIGNVVITTPTDTLYGDRAIYLATTNKATVTGNVRIERDANVIEGDRGEIDLDTNISKMFADPENQGRVRGVFYPE